MRICQATKQDKVQDKFTVRSILLGVVLPCVVLPDQHNVRSASAGVEHRIAEGKSEPNKIRTPGH